MTIAIRGKRYSVERDPERPDRYVLRGVRGAIYLTMRNVYEPHKLFLYPPVNYSSVMKGVWLTDADGTLRVLHQ